MVKKEPFGCAGASPVSRYTLTDGTGASASLLDYGATVQAITVPDRDGAPTDVALGYDTLPEYAAGDQYFGATVGRVANRIAGARFVLNGKEYRLPVNEGTLCSHGGLSGFDRKVWNAESAGENAVSFSRLSPDGEEGFPGGLFVRVTFSLREGALRIAYEAVSSGDTIVNLTNHTYFNLAGQGCGDVCGQTLRIDAERITRIGPDIVPTGEFAPVAGGPLDFRTAKPIGRDIGARAEQMDAAGGYDHNFVLSPRCAGLALPFAEAYCPETGIRMTCFTDQPGVQLYTPKDLGGMRGKRGAVYGVRAAFCLETQHFADAVHHPDFPTVVLRAGEAFRSATEYRFRAEK